MSGGMAQHHAAPAGTYASLTSMITLPKDAAITIEEDLSPLAFPLRTHKLYRTVEGLPAVRRLLLAFCQYNSEAGYFRGLASIAGYLLIIMGLDKEEEAFWTLTAMMTSRIFPCCNGQVC